MLERHNIQDYYLSPAKIYDKDKVISEDYYLFYCPILDYDIIYFEKSVLYTQLGIDKKKRKWHNVNNLEEFKNFKGIGNLKVERLVLNENFDKSLDFFTGRIGGILISGVFKKDIEESGLSGVHALSTYEPEVVIG